MEAEAYRVAIIVDPDYGERANDVADRCHTWIVISPANESAIAARRHDAFSSESGLTAFRGNETPERTLVSILSTVELHHGADSHDPPVSILEVIGTPVTEAIRDELGNLGFDEVQHTAPGFITVRCGPPMS